MSTPWHSMPGGPMAMVARGGVRCILLLLPLLPLCLLGAVAM